MITEGWSFAALELTASRIGWGTQLPAGRGRGLSVVNNTGSFTAQLAEPSTLLRMQPMNDAT